MYLEEYTEPFDLERWLAGEPACDEYGRIERFSHEDTSNPGRYLLSNSGADVGVFRSLILAGFSNANKWRMRPLIDIEGGFVNVVQKEYTEPLRRKFKDFK